MPIDGMSHEGATGWDRAPAQYPFRDGSLLTRIVALFCPHCGPCEHYRGGGTIFSCIILYPVPAYVFF